MLNPYSPFRQPIYASKGMVATSQPLAAQAGLFILREGGNAIDAAIATAAALTVLEPTSNGIGGDAFALVWTEGKLHGLNGSGRAPRLLSRDALQGMGISEIPSKGWVPVTVPGAPRAWADLHQRFGRLPFHQVLAPAIEYARGGYPLSPVLAHNWKRAIRAYAANTSEEFKGWQQTFTPEGFEPKAGQLWSSESHARTLEAIARSQAEEFYSGDLAKRIDHFAKDTGGFIRLEDLALHKSQWVQPISVEHQGHQVWEIPPNGQGIVALEALNILKGFELPKHREDPEGLHLQIEAMKLAFADAFQHVGDMEHVDVPVQKLLSEEHAAAHRSLISGQARVPEPADPASHGTVYLCTADGEGNMVSFIQSNYMGFGSGIVVPNTGIALQNRGHNFNLVSGHPNELKPRKRPYHTIIPGFLTRGDEPVGPFGVMGGFMQPQGHLQMVLNTLNHGMNPQVALDAPRWQWTSGLKVEFEAHMPRHVVQALQDMGHQVSVLADPSAFGRGQIIWRDPKTGVLSGGSDGRTDGQVAGY